MIQVSITKKGNLTNQGRFENKDLAEVWLKSCLAKNKFGLPARPELDARGKPTGKTLSAEYEIVIEDVIPDYAEERRRRYLTEVDPLFTEAIMENEVGQTDKLKILLEVRAEIKLKYPKPK